MSELAPKKRAAEGEATVDGTIEPPVAKKAKPDDVAAATVASPPLTMPVATTAVPAAAVPLKPAEAAKPPAPAVTAPPMP
eukprot:CAMPEP_0205934782 /NCGR_PEP_ID=MMETSP1325-20131115/37419_1 /ASSEMBLY_ACC=CAM_ASM_000708 /TAXON_ID=236786 /ORGANISM="Florenciella sp., Strain RCC1007" /LENGTH=79 /DNA_ID=CAMNT_0053304809 /DNA_START=37 /DNA_END=272 /DNA_ORIENTATION=+